MPLPHRHGASGSVGKYETIDIFWVRCFVDDYIGTVPIESRPEGCKAYELLRNNQADVLIAYRVDRIVRPSEEGDDETHEPMTDYAITQR